MSLSLTTRTGFKNPNNFCFLNSSLQFLNSIEHLQNEKYNPFKGWTAIFEEITEARKNLVKAMNELFAAKNNNASLTKLEKIKSKIIANFDLAMTSDQRYQTFLSSLNKSQRKDLESKKIKASDLFREFEYNSHKKWDDSIDKLRDTGLFKNDKSVTFGQADKIVEALYNPPENQHINDRDVRMMENYLDGSNTAVKHEVNSNRVTELIANKKNPTLQGMIDEKFRLKKETIPPDEIIYINPETKKTQHFRPDLTFKEDALSQGFIKFNGSDPNHRMITQSLDWSAVSQNQEVYVNPKNNRWWYFEPDQTYESQAKSQGFVRYDEQNSVHRKALQESDDRWFKQEINVTKNAPPDSFVFRIDGNLPADRRPKFSEKISVPYYQRDLMFDQLLDQNINQVRNALGASLNQEMTIKSVILNHSNVHFTTLVNESGVWYEYNDYHTVREVPDDEAHRLIGSKGTLLTYERVEKKIPEQIAEVQKEIDRLKLLVPGNKKKFKSELEDLERNLKKAKDHKISSIRKKLNKLKTKMSNHEIDVRTEKKKLKNNVLPAEFQAIYDELARLEYISKKNKDFKLSEITDFRKDLQLLDTPDREFFEEVKEETFNVKEQMRKAGLPVDEVIPELAATPAKVHKKVLKILDPAKLIAVEDELIRMRNLSSDQGVSKRINYALEVMKEFGFDNLEEFEVLEGEVREIKDEMIKVDPEVFSKKEVPKIETPLTNKMTPKASEFRTSPPDTASESRTSPPDTASEFRTSPPDTASEFRTFRSDSPGSVEDLKRSSNRSLIFSVILATGIGGVVGGTLYHQNKERESK